MKKKYIFYSLLPALIVLSAFFSIGYIHPDEHYQTIEFAGSKAGITDVAELPWEYGKKIRPWLQPGIYFLIIKCMHFFGTHDPYIIAFILRLFTGLISLFSLAFLTATASRWFSRDEEKSALLTAAALIWYIPFLSVRTSSETLAAAFFASGFSFIMRDLNPSGSEGGGSIRFINAAIGGIFLGLSFECRFQVGFMILGFSAWLIFIAKLRYKKLPAVFAGISVSIAAGILIDWWGYGEVTLTPYNYFISNIIEKTAAKFGTSPFYSYPILLLRSSMAPLFLVMIISLILSWIRHNRHALTWTTLPFVLIQSVIGHKEARFMYPLGIFGALFLLLAFSPYSGKSFRFIQSLWERRKNYIFKVLYAFNIICLVFLVFYPLKLEVLAQKHIYYTFSEGSEFYTINCRFYDPGHRMNFYMPEKYRIIKIGDIAELEKPAAAGNRSIYFIHQGPYPPFNSGNYKGRAILCYSTLPMWLRDFLFDKFILKKQIRAIKSMSFFRSWVWLYRIDPAGEGSHHANVSFF